MIYVDSSALLKVYFEEPDSDAAEQLLLSDTEWLSGRHTYVEVRRNLGRELDGRALADAREQFGIDWATMAIVELTEAVCDAAADIAETTGARSMDALHLGALQHAGGGAIPLLTFDLRQAQSARTLGWAVVGV